MPDWREERVIPEILLEARGGRLLRLEQLDKLLQLGGIQVGDRRAVHSFAQSE